MKLTGAQIAVKALENLGIKYTFGIPGTHTTEIYDALTHSKQIEPILVAHEAGGAFMADAISRTSDSVGCLMIVPAAGLTHALSGIGEAYLAGIPMLVISGGIRRDTGKHYQLHQIDMQPIAKNVTKAQYLIEKSEDIPTILYEAYNVALSVEPGPVFVEIPVEIMMFSSDLKEIPAYVPNIIRPSIDKTKISQAVELLKAAKNPYLFLGWGAKDAQEYSIKIAEKLQAPVSVTMQGKSVFPNNHSLFAGCFLGKSAQPSGRETFKKHDALLAVGCRFSEISTGSYGIEAPKNLIHIDINKEVFDKNYPTTLAIEGDATEVLKAIWEELKDVEISNDNTQIAGKIQQLKTDYFNEWLGKKQNDKVSPGYFFDYLNKHAGDDSIVVLDDGNHTFLACELLTTVKPGHLISPTDFNCMGYCIPAAIAAKLANPEKRVIAITGDGASQMTGLELITAKTYDVAPIVCVFNDGELGQIAQFQEIPLKIKANSIIGHLNFEGLALATGCEYLHLRNDNQIDGIMQTAFEFANKGKAVLVDVTIDYSKKTAFTKGVVKTNLSRFPLGEKIRFIARAVKRHTIG
ncbi:MAG: thiamine pyrophosphate-binding protein [Brumimicrobium sp.]|nr:thiamine pyrophosphate-binding protein [Brumimicrobium sp.]